MVGDASPYPLDPSLVSPEFLSSMWAGLIRIIKTMAEARSVEGKKIHSFINSFIVLPPDADS